MKVRFWCDSGANIHSCREEVLDTVEDLGFEEGKWEQLTDDDRQKCAEEWAWERLDIGVVEVE